MMNEKIITAVKEAIAKQKNYHIESITHESSLADLGISSLDAITIVYEIEEIFDVEVPNEKLESIETVQDIIDGISELLTENG
jgi:acyl carrier protein